MFGIVTKPMSDLELLDTLFSPEGKKVLVPDVLEMLLLSYKNSVVVQKFWTSFLHPTEMLCTLKNN
jgi:hypothetical protein